MAVIKTSNQQLYTGKGPADYKTLVKTYADLLSEATWTVDGSIVAYNGMITAVWCDTDAENNGVYFLLDPEVKTARGTPKVAIEANWHKLTEMSELVELAERVIALEDQLAGVEEDRDIITYGYRSGFPTEGEVNKLYVAADEGKSYVWFSDSYLLVGSATGEYEEPQLIYGGSAD
jgi:hypothetical protein